MHAAVCSAQVNNSQYGSINRLQQLQFDVCSNLCLLHGFVFAATRMWSPWIIWMPATLRND